MQSGYIYILRFEDNSYYLGCTNDLDRRLNEHKNKQSPYTKLKGNFKLVFSQKFDSVVEARKVEQKIKRFKSREIIERIIKDGYIKLHV